MLHDLVNDKEFRNLRGYVNLAKHARLVNVLNNGKQLGLDEYTYHEISVEYSVPKKELSSYMQEIHINIVSKVMNVYIMMQTMLKEKYQNKGE